MSKVFERLEPAMGIKRSRAATLVGLGAAAGAFGAAVMMSAATAPTARADDFTDILNAVEGDFASGQAAFGEASTLFGSNDVPAGLDALFSGVDDDSVWAPDNLLVGSIEALTNEGITNSLAGDLYTPAPTTFAAALADAQNTIVAGESFFTTGASDLSLGSFGNAALYDLAGSAYIFDFAPQLLVIGTADALGF
jgi:hypothetical protein